MKTATFDDAVLIGRLLDLDTDTVWEVITGMKLEIVFISWDGSRIHEECYTELVKAVQNAFSQSAGQKIKKGEDMTYQFAELSKQDKELHEMVLLDEVDMQTWYAVAYTTILGSAL